MHFITSFKIRHKTQLEKRQSYLLIYNTIISWENVKMDKERESQFIEELVEISIMVYVLETALNNSEQITSDTSPFGHFAGVIRNKINNLLEIIV